MWLFIAGATSTGPVQARYAAVTRLSAWPVAILAIVCAVAGAMQKASHRAASSRWLIGSWSGDSSPGYAPRAGSRSHSSTSTGAPVMPSNVARPTNRAPEGVWITRTA